MMRTTKDCEFIEILTCENFPEKFQPWSRFSKCNNCPVGSSDQLCQKFGDAVYFIAGQCIENHKWKNRWGKHIRLYFHSLRIKFEDRIMRTR